MKKHNKRSNVGLIYEFALRRMSECLTDSDDDGFVKARCILEKFYKSGTEIHKEFRLINALVNETVSVQDHASIILDEVKKSAHSFDKDKLVKEKYELVSAINESLGGGGFYDYRLGNYKMYATAATLLKYWRGEKILDVTTAIEYQRSLAEHLSRQKNIPSLEDHKSENVDNLVVKLMTDKLNENYDHAVSEEQKTIIREYTLDPTGQSLKTYLAELKASVLEMIEDYGTDKKSEILTEKLSEAKIKIQAESLDDLTDEKIVKFLDVAQLKKTLAGE